MWKYSYVFSQGRNYSNSLCFRFESLMIEYIANCNLLFNKQYVHPYLWILWVSLVFCKHSKPIAFIPEGIRKLLTCQRMYYDLYSRSPTWTKLFEIVRLIFFLAQKYFYITNIYNAMSAFNVLKVSCLPMGKYLYLYAECMPEGTKAQNH